MLDDRAAAPAGGQAPRRVAALIAPAVLVVVATGQLVLARTGDLSPWKGGGFGMFSTVESPGSRFVRIFLVDGDREIPVPVPPQAEDEWMRARTFPTDDRLERIVHIVAAGQWIPYEFTRAEDRYERFAAEQLGQDDGGVAAGDAITPFIGGAVFEDLGLYRMVTEDEVAPDPGDVLSFDHVRLELWQYELDSSGPELRSKRVSVVSAEAAR